MSVDRNARAPTGETFGVVVGPSLPRSHVFEIRRLLSGWIAVFGTSRPAESRVVAVLTAQDQPSSEYLQCPMLFLRHSGASPQGCRRALSPVFDLMASRDRLSLLAHLAAMVISETSAERGRGLRMLAGARKVFADLVNVQAAFAPGITVRDLATRLSCTDRSIRRWCRRDHLPGPDIILQWGLLLLATELLSEGTTCEEVAKALNLQHVESLQRIAKRLTGCVARPTAGRESTQSRSLAASGVDWSLDFSVRG